MIKAKLSLLFLILFLSLNIFEVQAQNSIHIRSHLLSDQQHNLNLNQLSHNNGASNSNQNHQSLIEMGVGVVWALILSIAGGLLCFAVLYYFFKWRNQGSQQTYVYQPGNQYGNQYNTMPQNPNYNQWQNPYPQNGPRNSPY